MKKRTLILIGIIILVLVAGTLGYFTYQKEQQRQTYSRLATAYELKAIDFHQMAEAAWKQVAQLDRYVRPDHRNSYVSLAKHYDDLATEYRQMAMKYRELARK